MLPYADVIRSSYSVRHVVPTVRGPFIGMGRELAGSAPLASPFQETKTERVPVAPGTMPSARGATAVFGPSMRIGSDVRSVPVAFPDQPWNASRCPGPCA